jgi:hypothetical protein
LSRYDPVFQTGKVEIITLSTCNGDIMLDGRAVVHARLISQILYDGLGEKKLVNADSAETKEVISANVYLEKLSLQYNLAKIRVNAPIVDISEGDSNNENQNIKNESTLNADTEYKNNINSQNNDTENENNADTENVKNMDVNVTEIRDNKNLKPLLDKVVDVKLTPEFYTSKSEYTATLPIGVEELILTLKAGDLQAKVNIFINDEEVKLPTLKLVEGNNTIKVKVTSRDSRFKKVYIIHIKRELALK